VAKRNGPGFCHNLARRATPFEHGADRRREPGLLGARAARNLAATMTSTSPRPFRVLGVQQIAIGGPDKAALRRLWVDLLGLAVQGTFRSERENVDEDIARAGAGPLAVEVDLMQPIDAEKRPRVHEPPLNHVGLWVDDLAAAVAWLGQEGVRFTPGGIRKGAAGHDVCFIHPKGDAAAPQGGEGVLLELVQAPPDVIAAFDRAGSP
jgi:lactoylglutathione lyase